MVGRRADQRVGKDLTSGVRIFVSCDALPDTP